MSFLLKNSIHGVLADSVFNEILSRRSNYYYFIGRVIEWEDANAPPTPEDTYAYEYETRNAIIGVKKVSISDVSYVVRRIDWLSGAVYDQYDPDYDTTFVSSTGATSLKDSNFYVLTDNFQVYKCLFNKNGAPSTVKPTGTEAVVLNTSDGYVWKYMYTIPLSLRNRFLTETYMPVQKSVLNTFYSIGEIDNVIIDNPGSGYLGNAEVTLSVGGVFGGSPNLVGSVSLTEGNAYVIGSGTAFVRDFYVGNTIFFTSNSNTYAVQNVFSNTVVVLTTPYLGSNVSGANYKNFSKQANVVANIVPVLSVNGSFLDVKIRNPGNNYITANITVVDNLGQGTGYYNTQAEANLIPVVYNGSIDRVLIADPGINYSANIQTTIATIGDGTGASFTPFINEFGQLEDVIINTRGQGYTYLDMEVVGDGANANIYSELSIGDLDTTQSTVELAAISGAINNIRIENAGQNYSNANVAVIGDGSGFSGTVVLSNTNTISHVNVVTAGFGYTYANVVITGSGSNARANAIFSPSGGHGSNAVKELFADAVMIYSTINNERNQGVDINNDFRQFGIIKDLKQFGNNRAFVGTLGSSCYLLNVNSTALLTSDVELELSADPTRKFIVIETVPSSNQILVLGKNNYSIASGDILTNPTTSLSYTVSSVVAQPTINKLSGQMIYIDNRTKISYSDQQLVTIRTIIKL